MLRFLTDSDELDKIGRRDGPDLVFSPGVRVDECMIRGRWRWHGRWISAFALPLLLMFGLCEFGLIERCMKVNGKIWMAGVGH